MPNFSLEPVHVRCGVVDFCLFFFQKMSGRKTKKIAIGAIVVEVGKSIDGSGDNYEVVTGDQVRALLAARSAT